MCFHVIILRALKNLHLNNISTTKQSFFSFVQKQQRQEKYIPSFLPFPSHLHYCLYSLFSFFNGQTFSSFFSSSVTDSQTSCPLNSYYYIPSPFFFLVVSFLNLSLSQNFHYLFHMNLKLFFGLLSTKRETEVVSLFFSQKTGK